MDISQYAVDAGSIDALSVYQIGNFFRHHESLTKDDCNSAAEVIIGGSVSCTPVQGMHSYTVVAESTPPSKVIQFRDSALDLELLALARQTYGEFVPNCEPCGTLADVYVYKMDFVPGVAFSRVQRLLLASEMESRLLQTVQDFARFFASAWINRSVVELPAHITRKLLDHYFCILDRLSQSLPERFQQKLKEIRQGLPLLFRPEYPMVLNHDDLLEMNIHVDEKTGHLTGIVDWADAMITPFGLSLGGLETILGIRTSSNWHFHPSHGGLRTQFWKIFYDIAGHISYDDQRAIEIARTFGLFRTYGFDGRPEKENVAPLKVDDQDLIYLEAFCL